MKIKGDMYMCNIPPLVLKARHLSGSVEQALGWFTSRIGYLTLFCLWLWKMDLMYISTCILTNFSRTLWKREGEATCRGGARGGNFTIPLSQPLL